MKSAADSALRLARSMVFPEVRSLRLSPAAGHRIRGSDGLGLYLHVPFCRSLCPHCPYNRRLYEEKLAQDYATVLVRELTAWKERHGLLRVSSVYFGGGTPTVLGPRLVEIADAVRTAFDVQGPLCLETTPEEVDACSIGIMRSMGIGSLSLGVQSFQAPLRAELGRQTTDVQIARALELAGAAGFGTLNIDLMFALAGQSLEMWRADLQTALSSGADQVTAYPLFEFPHSESGRARRVRRMGMPDFETRRAFFFEFFDAMASAGHAPVSVWSFQKPGAGPRYSSVTRSAYLGFGAGAASCTEEGFFLNTFDVRSYLHAIGEGRSATALMLPFTAALRFLHDVYWRIYDGKIPRRLLESAPSVSLRWRARALFSGAEQAGWLRREGGSWLLTREGSFWIHLLQNHAALPFVDRVWRICRRAPWPHAISL